MAYKTAAEREERIRELLDRKDETPEEQSRTVAEIARILGSPQPTTSIREEHAYGRRECTLGSGRNRVYRLPGRKPPAE